MGVKIRGLLLVVFLLVLTVNSVFGNEVLEGYEDIDVIVINSKNWQDVYTGLLTAKLVGVPAHFIRNQDQGTAIINGINMNSNVLLLEHARDKYINKFDILLTNKGHNVRKYANSFDFNQQIYKDISGSKLIVVDDSLGYDAISVAPYAVKNQAYVLFLNDENIDDLIDDLSSKSQSILLYGDLDRQVTGLLAGSNVEVINEGGRFANNIRIVDEFLKGSDLESVKLSNGEFIEKSFFTGDVPVVFIGKDRVPDETKIFMAESDIKFATVVGNDLLPLATTLKRELENRYDKEIGMVALIGKSQTNQGSGENQIEVLDTFPIPIYDAQIVIEDVFYNDLSKELSVTYKNQNQLKVYFISTITFEGSDASWGDDETQFLDGEKQKTINYEIPLEDLNTGEIRTLFGMSEGTLERQLIYNIENLEKVEIEDNSDIEILDVSYDKFNKAFKVKYENVGDTEVYIDTELIDVIVDGEEERISSNRALFLEPGQIKSSNVRAKLNDLDIEDNALVNVKAYYGMRDSAKFKTKSESLELNLTTNPLIYGGIVVLVVIIVILFVLRRKQKKEN